MKPWIPVEHRNHLPPVDTWVILKVDKRVNPQNSSWQQAFGGPLEYVTVGKLRHVDQEGIPVWYQNRLGYSMDDVVEWQELPDLSLYHRAVEPWSIYDNCTYETYEAGVLQ